MRKQDRMANQQQSRPPESDTSTSKDRPDREQMKNRAPEPPPQPRQPGKLPLPD